MTPPPEPARRRSARLEARLRGGLPARAEEYVLPTDDEDAAVELVYAEFVCREELGEAPRADDFLARFPHLRGPLEEQFAVHRAVHGPAATPRTGKQVGPYELIRELGRGGRGAVYEARDTRDGRTAAVKLLLSGEYSAPHDLDEFRREAEVLARLDHPNLVKLYEAGVADGRPFLAMEYVDGPTLAAVVGPGTNVRDAARVVELVAAAVHYAHTRGVVHRDLKPANILLSSAESKTQDASFALFPKVTDFGLAKAVGSASRGTRTGDVLGTLGYMAPEQAAGAAHHAGPPADVYALGGVLYELLTGTPPFDPQPTARTLLNVLYEPPPAPHRARPDCPRDLATICLKCLEKRPEGRYATAADLAADLRRFLDGRPLAARPVGPLTAAARWAARRPAAAAAIGATALAAVGITAGSAYHAHRLGQALQVAEGLRADVGLQKDAAERQLDDTRRALYALQLTQLPHLAAREPIRARGLLADERTCPPELRDFTWRYFDRQCRLDERTLPAHDGEVVRVIPLPDGRLVTAGTDGLVKVWADWPNRPADAVLAHPGGVAALAVRSNRWVVSAGTDAAVHFRELSALAAPPRVVAAAVRDLAADKDTLVAVCGDGAAIVWAGGAADPVRHTVSPTLLTAVAVAPGGGHFAVGGEDGTVRVVRTADGVVERELVGRKGTVHALAFSPDGGSVAVGGADGEARVWAVADGTSRGLGGHLYAVRGVAFAPSGLLATTGLDSYLKFWGAAGNELTNLMHARGTAVAFRGDRVVQGTAAGRLVSYRIPVLAPRPAFATDSPVAAVALAADGRFAAGDGSGRLTLWPPDRGPGITHAVSHQPLQAVAFAPNGTLLAHGTDNGDIMFRDAAFAEVGRLIGHTARPIGVAFSADGRTLVSASADGTARVWDVAGRKLVATTAAQPAGLLCIALSPDGSTVATGGEDHNVRLWDARTGGPKAVLTGHTNWALAVAFAPDGKRLATGGRDRTVRVWDLDGDGPPVVVGGYTNWVYSVAYSPDGRTLATASGHFSLDTPGELKFLDPRTGNVRASLGEYRSPLLFRGDGGALLAGVRGGVAELLAD
ncbi:protein kinase domain-containing protein [Limnoglobus roseus]|uniref:Serine/threonine protein kinase n=1 Tax=Limnoglobus roseus TaxID=2598579 RepID=A0A5C1A730_9BACT|nr:protein kinase [Limnoglobus roseus]QEL15001.1 serine/threonine protein kinase [Limnoglobus roseus]